MDGITDAPSGPQATPPPRWPLLVLLALLVAYLGVAFWVGGRVGLQFDEVNFAPAAMGLDDPYAFFVRHHVDVLGVRIPTALSSYRGALKAWVYAISLRTLGRDPAAIRIVPALGFAAFLAALFALLAVRLGRRAALAIVSCVMLTPDVLLASIFDWGPVVAGFAGTGVGILFLGRALDAWGAGRVKGGLLFGFLAGLAFGLAGFDKASHLWIVGSCGVGLMVAAPRRWLRPWLPLLAVALALGALAGSWPMIAYNLDAEWITFAAAAGPGPGDVAKTIARTFSGQGVIDFIAGERPPLPTPFPWVLLATVGAAVWGRAALAGHGAMLRFHATTIALLLFGILRSPQAIGAHHVVFLLVAAVVAAATVATLLLSRPATRAIGVSLILATLGPGACVSAWELHHLAVHSGRDGFDLRHQRFLEEIDLGDRKAILLDWGLTTPLILAQGRDVPREEPYFELDKPPTPKHRRWLQDLVSNPGHVVLVHGRQHLSLPGGHRQLAELIRDGTVKLTLESQVKDRHGAVLLMALRPWSPDRGGTPLTALP